MSWSRLRHPGVWRAVCILHPLLDSFSSRYFGALHVLLTSLFPDCHLLVPNFLKIMEVLSFKLRFGCRERQPGYVYIIVSYNLACVNCETLRELVKPYQAANVGQYVTKKGSMLRIKQNKLQIGYTGANLNILWQPTADVDFNDGKWWSLGPLAISDGLQIQLNSKPPSPFNCWSFHGHEWMFKLTKENLDFSITRLSIVKIRHLWFLNAVSYRLFFFQVGTSKTLTHKKYSTEHC
jgi:hypothetical protein